MATRRFKSRTFRRIFVRIPGGKTILKHERRKPSKAKCGNCGGFLSGLSREVPFKIRKLSKTERRPERPYGGVLCSKCMRALFIQKARLMAVKND